MENVGSDHLMLLYHPHENHNGTSPKLSKMLPPACLSTLQMLVLFKKQKKNTEKKYYQKLILIKINPDT